MAFLKINQRFLGDCSGFLVRSAIAAIPLVGIMLAPLQPILADDHAPHWSYGGAANPSEWGNLSEDFAQCEIGRDQSPINIENTLEDDSSTLVFNYVPVPLNIMNNGHTIEIPYEEGTPVSTISINGDPYHLLQFHFHTPSEHQLADHAAAMELHLVHRNDAGEIAVVGIMMEEGATHPVINTIWEHLSPDEGIQPVEGVMINAADLLPRSTEYFSYDGSLTTPPCSEGVRWTILAEPIEVSEEQIAAFESLYQMNARPLQPTNGRTIEYHD